MSPVKVTFVLLFTIFSLLAQLISAGGGRDFHYKTWQTHPHGHHHGGGHRSVSFTVWLFDWTNLWFPAAKSIITSIFLHIISEYFHVATSVCPGVNTVSVPTSTNQLIIWRGWCVCCVLLCSEWSDSIPKTWIRLFSQLSRATLPSLWWPPLPTPLPSPSSSSLLLSWIRNRRSLSDPSRQQEAKFFERLPNLSSSNFLSGLQVQIKQKVSLKWIF